MSGPVLVVVGASAGGVETVSQLVAGLPRDLDAAVLVVIHLAARAESYLPQILSRAGRLPAQTAADGQEIEPGRVYVAPPNRHLTVREGRMWLGLDAHVHGVRPAIDPLFESAAADAGERVVGIVLSGTLDDGRLGLRTIRDAGGVTVVQDPDTAIYPEMPRNAIDLVEPDHIVAGSELGELIGKLVGELALAHAPERSALEADVDPKDATTSSHPSGFTCPRCQGALWEEPKGDLLRFRCRVGHTWGEESLLAHETGDIEDTMWTALRMIEEKIALLQRLANQAEGRGRPSAARRFRQRAEHLEPHEGVLRDLIEELEP